MPPRVSRSSLPSSTPKSAPKATRKAIRKRDKRSLNAFAIAQETDPERLKIRRNRLGEVEKDEQPQRKRQRMADDDDDDEDDDEEIEAPQSRRKQQKSGFDELDMSAGSDSEGNEWRMGVVDDDDDEEIDSDEAFGESDEERFEGWTFRASSKGPRAKKGGAPKKDVNLDEDDEDMNDEEEEDDDLGEDAIDLAAALDQYEEMESADEADYDNDQKAKPARKKRKAQHSEDEQDEQDEDDSDSAPSEDDGEISDNFPDFDNDSDDNNAEKVKQLHSVVASLPQDDPINEPSTQADSSTTAARMLAALKGMSGVDPTLTRSLKTLSRNTETSRGSSSKAATNNGLLKAPLPKRQQDRIDRAAAYDKAKETLNRWIDTVKHNRRAEHLTFPLIDPLAQEAQGTSKLLPLESSSLPRSELENTIANILQASGLGGMSTKAEEAQLLGFEELKSNKLPLEEVLARRAELRKARDLMFREEARSKRVKKIKSKAYRRIHRKEAQRTAQKERDLLTAAGVEMSEDEDEVADRKRAEARMGARHKESKWAKSMKETGRAGWDGDARDAMTVAARKNEEVMMRKEGRRIRDSDASSEDESEDDDGDDNDEDGEFTLRSQLDKLDDDDAGVEAQVPKSGISQLAFMQRADAARKKQNEEDILRMKRELAGEESDDEEMLQPTETSIGRRIFGPSQTTETPKPVIRNELEEGRSDSEDEDGQNIDSSAAIEEFPNARSEEKTTARSQSRPTKAKGRGQLQGPATKAKPHVSIRSAPPTLPEDGEDQEEATLNLQQSSNPQSIPSQSTAPGNTDGWTVVHHNDSDNDNDNTSDVEVLQSKRQTSRSPSPTNFELVQAAFGTADDSTHFASEKASLAANEDTKTTSTALPGWGSWAGTGLSKGERHHASKSLSNPSFIKKTSDGVAADRRRDKKLKDVIISERRNKKGAKYLAPTLPHQFENRAQYERSLRLPIGPEWTTKETFQQVTKPRVLLKKGVVVQPMRRPMV